MSRQPTITGCPADRIDRRAFIRRAAALLVATNSANRLETLGAPTPALKFGVVTDIHYADKPPAGNRYYRESVAKLQEAVGAFNAAEVAFAVEMGDLIDAADSVETELAYLQTIDTEYAKCRGERHYVLGNHCVWTLTKEQFVRHSGARKEYYSFDKGAFHFIVLDACYRKDGVSYGAKNFSWDDADIPAVEQRWLAADLKSTNRKTVVFVHQRIDTTGPHGIKSGEAVRKLLEDSGKVLAVFQGHHHRNDHLEINGIHYCTLAALVDGTGLANSAYAIVELFGDGTVKVNGVHNQAVYTLRPKVVPAAP